MNASNGGAPKPVSEHVALAVITTEVAHIKEGVERIERALQGNVPHTSWEQRNRYVDQMFVEVRADITQVEANAAKAVAEVWAEIKSKRVPWTSIAAFAVAGLLAFFEILDRLGT
jgi:hypothetical protein